MVSLNFQTPDLGMQLNQGKFEYNGNSGFLLKPDFLRRSDKYFDPFSESPVDGVIAAYCSIRIISGQFVSEKRIGTYVEVDMYGLPTDTIRREFRTKTISNNGLNPVYNEDAFVFRKIILPDLACLRIGLFEETGKLIGQRVLPLDGLQAGYRHISLRTEGNFPLALPTLFCHIVLKTYVPEGLGGFVDALNNPKEFLSKEDKRLKQLANIGIDEKEISAVPSERRLLGGARTASMTNHNSHSSSNNNNYHNHHHSQSHHSNGSGGQTNNNSNSAETKKGNVNSHNVNSRAGDDAALDKLTRETLQNMKGFQKLLKKQSKENEALKKKHNKERALMQKQHSSTMDKMTTSVDLKSPQIQIQQGSGGTSPNPSSPCREATAVASTSILQAASTSSIQQQQPFEKRQFSFKSKIKETVDDQSKSWAALIERQRNEQKLLNNEQVEQQCACFQTLLLEAQKQRKKDLEMRQKKETDNLKSAQAKQSVEDSKRLLADTNIRTKQDRDRRLRELNSTNMKKFIDERKRLANRHQQESSLSANMAKDEEDTLNEENNKLKESKLLQVNPLLEPIRSRKETQLSRIAKLNCICFNDPNQA
jgi:phosphatidylinositol phospholipase C beta